jgi:hypothetical protein
MKALLAITFSVLLIGAVNAEIYDFDNVPYSPGFYIQGYPTFSTASKAYDSEGESQDLGDNFSYFGLALRPTYWGMMNDMRWQISAAVPFNSYSWGDISESGIGDIQASVALWFLDDHRKGNYASFWIWTDIPVGDETKGLGTGQMNLRPGLSYATEKMPYFAQASVFYNYRMKGNLDFGLGEFEYKYGDEFWANASFGYSANEQMTPRLELQTGWGMADTKIEDIEIADSKVQWFKVGPALDYQINPNASFQIAALYNVMGKNSNQSFDIGARVNWGFNK